MSNELIVLAAPIAGEPYYARQIIRYADDVLIMVDEGAYGRYVEALGEEGEMVNVMPMPYKKS